MRRRRRDDDGYIEAVVPELAASARARSCSRRIGGSGSHADGDLRGPIRWPTPSPTQRATFERRIPILMAAFYVLVIAQMLYFTRGAERDFDALRLRPRISTGEVTRARRALSHYGRTGRWMATGAGLAILAAIQEINVQRWSRFRERRLECIRLLRGARDPLVWRRGGPGGSLRPSRRPRPSHESAVRSSM